MQTGMKTCSCRCDANNFCQCSYTCNDGTSGSMADTNLSCATISACVA